MNKISIIRVVSWVDLNKDGWIDGVVLWDGASCILLYMCVGIG
jgi:hypothetical protein